MGLSFKGSCHIGHSEMPWQCSAALFKFLAWFSCDIHAQAIHYASVNTLILQLSDTSADCIDGCRVVRLLCTQKWSQQENDQADLCKARVRLPEVDLWNSLHLGVISPDQISSSFRDPSLIICEEKKKKKKRGCIALICKRKQTLLLLFFYTCLSAFVVLWEITLCLFSRQLN